jgi:hypothetical protein
MESVTMVVVMVVLCLMVVRWFGGWLRARSAVMMHCNYKMMHWKSNSIQNTMTATVTLKKYVMLFRCTRRRRRAEDEEEGGDGGARRLGGERRSERSVRRVRTRRRDEERSEDEEEEEEVAAMQMGSPAFTSTPSARQPEVVRGGLQLQPPSAFGPSPPRVADTGYATAEVIMK